MEKVYENIKKLRLEQGLSQEELAKRVGYTDRSSIAKIEGGRVDLTNSKIAEFARVFGVDPAALMGWKARDAPLPSNISVPAAHGVPILGTICAGDGIYAEQNFSGYFFVDQSIRADCCLYVHGDSMIDAGIKDGDIAFLRQDDEIEDGDICGVVLKDSDEAVLKKLYRADGYLILQPCNAAYKPIVKAPEDVRVVGKMIGVFHKV